MFRLLGKKIITIFISKILLILIYDMNKKNLDEPAYTAKNIDLFTRFYISLQCTQASCVLMLSHRRILADKNNKLFLTLLTLNRQH